MPKLPVIVYGSVGLASAAAGVVCAWAGAMSMHATSAAAEVSDGFLNDMICSGHLASCCCYRRQREDPKLGNTESMNCRGPGHVATLRAALLAKALHRPWTTVSDRRLERSRARVRRHRR